MKRIIQGVVLAGSLVVGSASFAEAAKAGTAEYKGFVVPSDAKGLLERIHHANQSEIKQAQLAVKTSQNADVKAFAEQMITQHTDADKKVMALAQSKKLKLADMPKPMNDTEKKAMAAEKADMDKLQALTGEAFDGCYMSGQLGAHDAVLGKLAAGKQAAAGDAELAALVDELTQSVSMHRQHAYALLGKMAPMANAMGTGNMGTGTGAMGNTGTTPPKGTMGSDTRGTGGTTSAGTSTAPVGGGMATPPAPKK